MTQEYVLNPYTENSPMYVVVRHVDKYVIRSHRTPRILLVIQGTLQFGLHGKIYEMTKDQFAFVNSRDIYSTFSTSHDNMILSIQVTPDVISPELHVRIDSEKLLEAQTARPELFASFSSDLLRIAAECNKRAAGFEERAASIVRNLFDIVQSEGLVSPRHAKKADSEEEQTRLMKILGEINDRCSEDLTLEDIAESNFMNYFHLSHLFKERTGINFRDYLSMCRLSKAFDLLNQKNKTVTDIAFESGFGSTKAFLAAFRKIYGITPAEYRHRLSAFSQSDPKSDWDPETRRKTFSFDEEVRRLLQTIGQSLPSLDDPERIVNHNISLDTASGNRARTPAPLKLLNFGHAKEGLYAQIRDQIRQAVSLMPFDYVRFQGVFSDAMGICRRDANGNITYCWTYLDMLLDFLISLDLQIFMQISYMPSVLAKENISFFWWNANTSMPENMEDWCRLVNAMTQHCIQRYGRETVAQWCFEIWNEPDMGKFWQGTKEEYFRFYLGTALAIKSAEPRIKVGGPGVTLFSNTPNKWLGDFMEFCEFSSAPLDFVSVHVYGEQSSEEEEYLFPALNKRQLLDQDVSEQIIRQISDIRNYKKTVQVYITEWNLTVRQRFLIRDTAFMGPYVIDSLKKLAPYADMIGYWALSDLIEELDPPSELFHGGLGLMTNNGIPKPSEYALSMIARLGPDGLGAGDGWIAARNGNTYQILCYNIAQFDSLSMSGEFSSLTDTDRYNIYLSTAKRVYRIILNGISGPCRVLTETIDREHGSAFDEWLRMGAPAEMRREDVNLLREMSVIQKTVQIVPCVGTLSLDVHCSPHGCVFTEISAV